MSESDDIVSSDEDDWEDLEEAKREEMSETWKKSSHLEEAFISWYVLICTYFSFMENWDPLYPLTKVESDLPDGVARASVFRLGLKT